MNQRINYRCALLANKCSPLPPIWACILDRGYTFKINGDFFFLKELIENSALYPNGYADSQSKCLNCPCIR